MKFTNVRIHILLYILINSLVVQAQSSDQQELDSLRNPIYNSLDSMWTVEQTFTTRLKKTTDLIIKKDLQNQIQLLQNIQASLYKQLYKVEIEFARGHPSSPLSMEILFFRFLRPEGLELYDVIDSIYREMPDEIQNSVNGKIFQGHLSYFKNSAVGQPAPPFEVKDINNKPLALNRLRGKYILLDFWASWCIPCRQDHPFLKEVYKKYKQKGLEIISISSDKELQKWKAAIQQDGTGQWKHFSSLESNPNLEDIYYVVGIPVKVLIDTQGVIIARWLGGGEAEINEDMRKKFEEIFD